MIDLSRRGFVSSGAVLPFAGAAVFALELLPTDNPAEMLRRYLIGLGVTIKPMHMWPEGSKVGTLSRYGTKLWQRHVAWLSDPLGDEIRPSYIKTLASNLASFGKSLAFAQLWMPPIPKHGVIDGARYESKEVTARHLKAYDITRDDYLNRFDVLFCKA